MPNLREIFELDLGLTLEDNVNGYGWPIIVEDPDGNTAPLNGQSGDIGLTIDPNTGVAVSGREAHVALRVSSIEASSLVGLPRGQAKNDTKKPWIFRFEDINGHPGVFMVRQVMPDETGGVITCIIEAYKEAP